MTARSGRGLAAALPAASTLALAVCLGWAGVRVNMERACTTADTPYFALCPADDVSTAAYLSRLRSHINSNPGDAVAFVRLTALERGPGRDARIEAASLLAPADPATLALRADTAILRGDWAVAAQLLVALAEYHDSAQASLALAQMIGAGKAALLRPYLVPGTHWLAGVLSQLQQAKVPFNAALPLVGPAIKASLIDLETARYYMRQLKAARDWADAFSLWVAIQPGNVPLVYNGSFEQPLQPDGFDWELPDDPPDRAGADASRVVEPDGGSALHISFTGRPISVPLIRQYVLLAPGRYLMRGRYMGNRFQMDSGLAWSVRCTNRETVAGRSAGLNDTKLAWRPFQFEINVPSGCGVVASLQLEPTAAPDAVAGAHGEVEFNDLTLTAVHPTAAATALQKTN